MKRILFSPLVFVLLIASCQSGTKQDNSEQVSVEPKVNVIESEDTPKMVARLSIEGMGCEMACGGAIKKALGDLDGVVATDIDFDSEKETDFAIVEFDDKKVSSDKMVETVSALRKGQYKVSGVTIDKFVPKGSGKAIDQAPKSDGKSSAASDKQIDTRSITVPNILDILNRL